MFGRLIALANHFDNIGLRREADEVDSILQEAAVVRMRQDKDPIPAYKEVGPGNLPQNIDVANPSKISARPGSGKPFVDPGMPAPPPNMKAEWITARKNLWESMVGIFDSLKDLGQNAHDIVAASENQDKPVSIDPAFWTTISQANEQIFGGFATDWFASLGSDLTHDYKSSFIKRFYAQLKTLMHNLGYKRGKEGMVPGAESPFSVGAIGDWEARSKLMLDINKIEKQINGTLTSSINKFPTGNK